MVIVNSEGLIAVTRKKPQSDLEILQFSPMRLKKLCKSEHNRNDSKVSKWIRPGSSPLALSTNI
jgi:hypothetical protein